ncbi:MAG: TIR domain-containing protein [Synergistaceae bacterium]|jgi:tetratricopeptide (TPR) repeat protein|nr:TIR domain-containing protein [Synergistaceae bacterium]
MNADNLVKPAREYEFYAFISYKRGESDEKWARWLQRELERYRIPVADLQGESTEDIPKRLRVFRDKSDLGSHPTVEQGLSENLDSSRFLIVVCSKRSAESPYVDAEAGYIMETGREDKIILFEIEPPAADAESGRLSFYPRSLRESSGLLTAAFNPLEDRDETFVRLLARLLRVDYESLQQAHLRASRRLAAFRLAAVVGIIFLMAALSLWAMAAESRATERRIESEELADFLTFDLIREAIPYIPSEKIARITDRVREYYERWEPREPRSAFARAVNLGQRGGEAYNLDGDLALATGFRREALEILEHLREYAPDSERYFVEYSQTLVAMGGLFEIENNGEEAMDYYLSSLDASRAFSKEFPNSLWGMAQAADSLEHLGKLAAEEGRFGDANVFYRECGGVWDEILTRWGQYAQTWHWRMKYGYFQSGHAYIDILQSRYDSALRHIESAMEIFEVFYEEETANLVARLFFADELNMAVFAGTKAGELDLADSLFTIGEEIWRGLVRDDPQPNYVFGWLDMLTHGAALRIEQGRADEAGALLDEAEELLDALLRLRPDDEAYLSKKSRIEEYRERTIYH